MSGLVNSLGEARKLAETLRLEEVVFWIDAELNIQQVGRMLTDFFCKDVLGNPEQQNRLNKIWRTSKKRRVKLEDVLSYRYVQVTVTVKPFYFRYADWYPDEKILAKDVVNMLEDISLPHWCFLTIPDLFAKVENQESAVVGKLSDNLDMPEPMEHSNVAARAWLSAVLTISPGICENILASIETKLNEFWRVHSNSPKLIKDSV